MMEAVGIGPITCRLRALRSVLAPAATGSYNFLTFVQFSASFLPANCDLYTPDYALL